MRLPSCELVFISLCSPLLVGVYEDGVLKRSLTSDKASSEAIIELLSIINKQYKIKRIIYVNGPGSFMGLKIAYVILSIFCDIINCEFGAISAFSLNNSGAVPAKKDFCFVKEGEKILLKKVKADEIKLPQNLENLNISFDTLPFYVLDAV